MKMIFFTLFTMAACMSCAQQKLGIEKVYAFNQVRMPGNIPVDDHGNPLVTGPDTLTYIYIETTGEAPEWKKATYNGKVYAASAALIDPVPVDLGKDENGNSIIIRTRKENKLWQITLSSQDPGGTLLLRSAQQPAREILLEGTYRGKPFIKTIKAPVVLKSPESV